MTEYFTRYTNDQGDYEITFRSNDKVKARTVEEVCRAIIDGVIKSPEDVPNRKCSRASGHWIEIPFLMGTSHKCSLCGEYYGMPHGIYNYCPNCGAEMRE